ncbi:MAG: beta-ketoacyl-[acyl-carrier-protein] synthase family protein [Thermodesulfobacteriota bacterium]
MSRTVAVTGIGVVTPLEGGSGIDDFWDALIEGVNAVSPVELFDVSGYSTGVAAEIKEFRNLAGEGRWFSFLKTSFDMALNNACLDPEDIDKRRAGIIVGTVLGEIHRGEACWRDGGGEPPYKYHLFSGAERLAEEHGFKGPVTTISTACASGTDAIGMASRSILDGAADVMIAGGGDVLSEFAFSGFNCLGAMTGSAVRPFDADRDGLALGEGAAFLVLEEMERALERSANIYGEVSGYAACSDAVHMTAPDREGEGLARAIRDSLRDAGRDHIDYINAHGTGTLYNDLMETRAIKRVFGKQAYKIPVSSVKSMLGHSFGAAGAIEAAVCLLAMRGAVIPPTANLRNQDPECDLDYVPGEKRPGGLCSAMSLSAGFGGQNAALVLESLHA